LGGCGFASSRTGSGSFEPYRAAILSLTDGEIMRVTPETDRPKAILGADVHFLMIAMKHLDGVLKVLGSNAPRLDKDLKTKAIELRRLLEHWWESAEGKGAGKAIARSTASMRRLHRSNSTLIPAISEWHRPAVLCRTDC